VSASQRTKGAAAEREFRGLAIDTFGLAAVGQRRLAQTRDGGHDLDLFDFLAVEVKRQERASVYAWLEQAQTSAPQGRLPCVVWRPSRRGWCVVMMWDPWAELVREAVR